MRDLGTGLVAVVMGLSGALYGCVSSDDSQTAQKVNTPPPDPGAIPCVGLKTDFAGDDRCIQPPDPSLGIQMHVGPSSYTDPAVLAPFVMQPGDEKTECYYLTVGNPDAMNFYVQHFRMRPGSHHMIIHMSLGTTAPADGWGPCDNIYGQSWLTIAGTQLAVGDEPPGGVIPPEDANLYRPLVANAHMAFELHFYNSTEQPTLREVWVNFMKKETDQNSQILGGVFMIGRLGTAGIAPGEQTTLDYTFPWPASGSTATEDLRVVMLYGHRHAHTTRFSVWKQPGGDAANRQLIYEDYDWHEPKELIYNTVVNNPAPDAATQTGGGTSGMVTFAPGDVIEWACDVDNSDAKNQELGIATQTLLSGNEVFTAEMCNLFGNETTLQPGSFFWSGAAARQ